MTIKERIEAALNESLPAYYSYMPAFAPGEEPESYGVYNYTYRGTAYASGRYTSMEYNIYLSIFAPTTAKAEELEAASRAALEAQGAHFTGTDNIDLEDIYPHKRIIASTYKMYEERK